MVRIGPAVLVPVLAAVPWAWFVVRDAFGSVTDVLAIVLPVVVAALVVAALAVAVRLRRRRWLVPAASALAMGVTAVVGPWLPADAGPVAPGHAVTVVAPT
ncbi:hypothetical protein ACQPWY_09265 [Pseudonocardia xinjiangensis]|uniref:hypothetical protein n=1 Tax=Pseudonocardia xinjiangensis TaxID=75289 RepID=UPI003D8E096B